MKKIISWENIVISFGEGNEKHNVLDSSSVEINEGEFVSVMGPYNSGKSTLMYVLSGMDFVDIGEVKFDGQIISTHKENGLANIRRTKMGFIFQKPTLLKNLNILDNIILPPMHKNGKSAAMINVKTRTFMIKTGIPELEEGKITQALGRQLERVGICSALVGNPKINFGDEPTGVLNSKSANEIIRLLAEIHRSDTTILLVTYNINVAANTERVLFMIDGKIARKSVIGPCNGG